MLTPENFRIVYINLSTDVMRDVKIDSKLKQLGLPYERFDGVCPDRDVWSWKNMFMDFKDHQRRNMTWGELGCALSHRKIWQECVDSGDTILVLEDDVSWESTHASLAKEIMYIRSVLESSDYEFCYLGRQPLQPGKETRIEIYPGLIEPRYSWLTHAYMLTPSAARKLLAAQFDVNNIIPSDELIPWAIGRGADAELSRIKRYPMTGYPTDPVKALATTPGIIGQPFSGESHTEKSGNWGSKVGTSDEMFSHDIDPASLFVRLVTVATDPNNEGFHILLNSAARNYWNMDTALNLGDDVNWAGGDMIAPGGGHKMNLLKKAFTDGLIHDDEIIIFVDGYDVGMVGCPYDVVRRWLDNYNPNSVLFAAEPTCWPDPSLAPSFPEVKGKYKYLNSGTFIGRAKNVRALLDGNIPDSHDDQLAYQMKFFDHRPETEGSAPYIELDYACKIFQCLHFAEEDIQFDPVSNRIFNTVTGSDPLIVHGNGHSKDIWLNLMRHTQQMAKPVVFTKHI